MSLIICDLDGTLADHRHRIHLVGSGDWDAYHSLLGLDKPHQHVLNMLKNNVLLGGMNVFFTGRPEQYRSETIKWLDQACDLSQGDDYESLWMRPKGDFSQDVLLKKAMLTQAEVSAGWIEFLEANAPEELDKRNQEEWAEYVKSTILLLEDRDRLVAMWRDLGYACWQTAMGEF